MIKRNPKQIDSNLFDCKPQIGKCPSNCNQCFYNRDEAFYVDINKSHMPSIEEVGEGIMRVNSGHDSNFEREKVIRETEIYKKRFFNTSIPKFDFPGPVVFTANKEEEETVPTLELPPPANLMFIRLRVSSTNLDHIYSAVSFWTRNNIPIVLTFMAYYDKKPVNIENYIWKKRHINSYWCPIREFMAEVLKRMKKIGGRLVSLCSDLDSYSCKECRNCETYYYQTLKHMKEVKDL